MAGALLIVVVAGSHGLLWSRLGRRVPAPLSVLQVRQAQSVHVPVRPGVADAGKAVAAAAAGSIEAAPGRPRSAGLGRIRATPETASARAAGGEPDHAGARAPLASAAAIAPPLYPARLPGPARLRFSAWRGEQKWGTATLDWQFDGVRYQLSLRLQDDAPSLATSSDATTDAKADVTTDADAGPSLRLAQTSIGRVGPHGLQPERFEDRRARRGARALSVRCDEAGAAGGVSFSAATARWPCVAGLQDGLSWWLQLAGIVAGQAALPEPGREFSVAVAHLRGTVDVWTFVVEADADAATLKLVRRPDLALRPYDTTAEVWLDAQAPHWPRRVRLQSGAGEAMVWTREPSVGAAGS
jgi:hypothetical protein